MCDQKNGLSHAKKSSSDDVTLPDDLSLSDDSEPEEEPGRGPFDPQLRDLNPFDDDDDDDEDDEGGEGEVQLGAAPGAQSCFSLKGGSSGFSSRSLSIFSCLDSVARPASAAPGKESTTGGTLARPGRPPPKAVPDYLLHPERWTRYSLEDVPETSEQQNRAAARQFLSGLQQRKQQQLDAPDSSCSSSHKVVFSRPSGRPGRERPAEEPKTAGGKEMSLSHLEEEEEEEEEGGEGGSASTRRGSEVKEKNTEKVEERGGGLGHLDQEDEEKEEVKAPVKLPEAEERKRTWEQRGGAVEEREEENQQASAGFVSFRKSNRKNYRRSSEQEDS